LRVKLEEHIAPNRLLSSLFSGILNVELIQILNQSFLIINRMASMGAERRRFKRRYLMYYSRVYNRQTGDVIGYMVDLTPEGAMIISEEPIEVGKDFRLRIDMPEEISQKASLDFEAKSVWCKPDIDPHFFGTGFYINNLPEQDINLIERMIQEYGFRDG
jgi:hypothetical protein